MTILVRRPELLLCLSLLACAEHRPPREEQGRRNIAIVKVLESTGARLATVNGRNVGQPAQIHLGAGDYTLGVRYATEGADGLMQEVSFTADAGHFYELSVAPPSVTGKGWIPVLVDNSTQTQIYPY
jgi:hypothetical protein